MRVAFGINATLFTSAHTAAGGLAFINSIGTVGGFAGPYMMGWLREFSGSYVVGLGAMAAIMVAAMVAMKWKGSTGRNSPAAIPASSNSPILENMGAR